MSIPDIPLHQQAKMLSEGSLRVTELVQALADRARETESTNAFLSRGPEDVLSQALEAERRFRAGHASALAGIPLAVKDNICVKNIPMTCASRLLEHYIPPYDATVIRMLRAQNAIVAGKTNLDEFAMGSSNEYSAFGPCLNPWAMAYSPGGSSGGSAVAVACGAASGALGSDTGGSIRLPASMTGIVGLKPTYGRVSRYGLTAYASSLDQVGPMGRCVRDVAILLGAIAGSDPHDATSLNAPVPDYCEGLEDGIAGVRIALPDSFFAAHADEEVLRVLEEAVALFQKLGARVRRFELPPVREAIAAYYVLASAEASSNLARFDGVRYGRRSQSDTLDQLYTRSRTEGFGPEVCRRILLGTFVLSAGYRDAYYAKAQAVRRKITAELERVLAGCELVLMPTSPVPAFKLGMCLEPLAMYQLDAFTLPANLAGLPAISVPAGVASGGLPIGIQLLGAALSEPLLLRVARAFERETHWHTKRPPRIALE